MRDYRAVVVLGRAEEALLLFDHLLGTKWVARVADVERTFRVRYCLVRVALGIKGLEWVVVSELGLVLVLGFLGLGLGLAYVQGNRVSAWALHARLRDLLHKRVDF